MSLYVLTGQLDCAQFPAAAGSKPWVIVSVCIGLHLQIASSGS